MITREPHYPYTFRDYLLLPKGAPVQLIGGELVHEAAPTPYHQRLSHSLSVEMTNHVNLHGLGTVYVAPIDVYFDIFDAFQPDIIFISTARADIIGKKYIDGAPDMVVEVLSPSSARKDLTHKMVVYERSGVREYWVVDPKAFTVDVYVYREGGFKLDTSVGRDGAIRSTAVEGFEISAETIFGDVWVAPLGRKSIGDCRCYL